MRLLLPPPGDQRPRRFVQLFAGLLLFGFSTALLVEASLGLSPWDVFHQGVSLRTPLSIGAATIGVGVVVLLFWIPLRQFPGFGTVANAIVVGIAIDVSLAVLPEADEVAWQTIFLAGGIVLNGFATGLYIGAGLGPGPRDGLMTGLAARGHSIRLVRTSLEVAVLFLGWVLGGSVGIGTVAYALAIGPLAHVFIPALTIGRTTPRTPPDSHASIA